MPGLMWYKLVFDVLDQLALTILILLLIILAIAFLLRLSLSIIRVRLLLTQYIEYQPKIAGYTALYVTFAVVSIIMLVLALIMEIMSSQPAYEILVILGLIITVYFTIHGAYYYFISKHLPPLILRSYGEFIFAIISALLTITLITTSDVAVGIMTAVLAAILSYYVFGVLMKQPLIAAALIRPGHAEQEDPQSKEITVENMKVVINTLSITNGGFKPTNNCRAEVIMLDNTVILSQKPVLTWDYSKKELTNIPAEGWVMLNLTVTIKGKGVWLATPEVMNEVTTGKEPQTETLKDGTHETMILITCTETTSITTVEINVKENEVLSISFKR